MINAFYDRVEADALLSPFFPGGVTVQHREHVIDWWSEVFGGPPTYTAEHGGYEAMLSQEGQQGLARELARMNLPANIYTQWYWKVDLHNLFHFLRLRADRPFDLRSWLRPAVFIPESKRLNVLLREFRVSHNHMAVVVDEYAGVCGLITIEDVLEQIVGDIEDEYDFDETEDNIRLDQNGRYRVKATTEIEDFNEAFATHFSDEEYDTVGGLVIRHFGRLPKRGEAVELEGLKIQVLRADSRRVHTLVVERLPKPAVVEE